MSDYRIRADYIANPARRPESDRETLGAYWTPSRVRLSGRYQYSVYAYAKTLAESNRAQVIVDFGCGPATKLCGFFDDGYRLIGLDTTEAVRIARTKCPRGEFLAMDFGSREVDLGKLRSSADLVICADVIEHLEEPEILLELLRDTAKPGSPIAISTPCREKLLGRAATRPSNPEHVREWSRSELEKWIRGMGFEIFDHQIQYPFQLGLTWMTLSYVGRRFLKRLPLKTTQVIVFRSQPTA